MFMKKIIVLLLWFGMLSLASAENYCKKGNNCSYFDSWEVKALTLQNRLDQKEPLKRAIFPHTHNSYNNKGDGYWADINHIVGISDQLKMGIRFLELDVASYPWKLPYSSISSIRLCHKVCSKSDMSLNNGLKKIRDFLKKNKNEVILIWLEVNLPSNNKSKFLKEVRKKIDKHIGNYVYRPSGGSCRNFDDVMLNKSKLDILNAGKNVVIFSKRACYKGKMQSWVFDGRLDNRIKQKKDSDTFLGFPNCTYDSYKISDFNSKFWRSYNDGTLVGKALDDADNMTVSEIKAMRGCGINVIGPERLTKWMKHHKAQVWSWSEGQPNGGKNSNCAMSQNNGRFHDRNCSVKAHFACRHKNHHNVWKVTNTVGSWKNGSKVCKNEFGNNYFFAVPRNGYQNNLLNQAKSKGVNNVWLSYSDSANEGNWKEKN
jgi:hypothetical protein